MRSALPSLAAALVIALGAASIAAGAGGGGGGGAAAAAARASAGAAERERGSGAGTGSGTGTGTAPSPPSATASPANRSLDGSLNLGMRQAGRFSGAYVVDLTANRTLYAKNADTGRLAGVGGEALHHHHASCSGSGPAPR